MFKISKAERSNEGHDKIESLFSFNFWVGDGCNEALEKTKNKN